MTDITQILNAIERGDPTASDKLLPLVYDELRVLARQRLAHEKPGQTLQGTALVHEAYLRLVGKNDDQAWDNRGHFFAAAAEAMRRILVDAARRKQADKRGGQMQRVDLTMAQPALDDEVNLIELNDALEKLARHDVRKANLVKLRYFAGLTIEQSAKVLHVSIGTANNDWAYAKTWLRREMS